MKKISILCPTRQRADRAFNYAWTVFNTARNSERVEVLFYVDTDDPENDLYIQWSINPTPYNITTVFGEPMSVSKSWNILAEKCTGDILLMGNDDLIHETEGWDEILEEVSNEFPDDIYCAFFDDGINHGKHCAFPAVSRKWYNTLGYFTPGIFEFIANDTWVFDIAKKIDRVRYIPEVLVRHEHHSVTKVKDETTKRHREGANKDRIKRDLALFKKTNSDRERAAEKLREITEGRLIQVLNPLT
jgi:glycosyl transferase/beta-hydroxylase protein BlmF